MGFKDELLLSDSSSGEEEGEEERVPPKQEDASKLESLKKNWGGGPSVLLLEENKGEQSNWSWGNGRSHTKASEESVSERENTRGAANEATAIAVAQAKQRASDLKRLRKKEFLAQKKRVKTGLSIPVSNKKIDKTKSSESGEGGKQR